VGETTCGGFETLGGDKTHCFISRTKAYNNFEKLTTQPLSFSLVLLSILSTQNSISLATYLYTNSKQDNSTFKCEGGWRHAAGGWRLVGWWLGGDSWWLPSLTFWIEFTSTNLPFKLNRGMSCQA
jgi:hypothetical protein